MEHFASGEARGLEHNLRPSVLEPARLLVRCLNLYICGLLAVVSEEAQLAEALLLHLTVERIPQSVVYGAVKGIRAHFLVLQFG